MPRILIVEDDPDIALGLELDFKDEGYEVEVARDGVEGALRAKQPGWDIVILDVMLPGKDGFEVCRDIRRARLRTPILMLTARAEEAEKVMGLDMGADDYITKPFSPRELRARVRALVRRASATAPLEPVQRVGAAEVDFARAQLKRGSERWDLTAIELKMLQLFMRHPGRVFGRTEIIDAAWGPDVYVTDRVVDTHIVKLRRRIEPDPVSPSHIVSVRGLGYRFEP
jgi:DNA-binding response OmpR family regulator